VNILIPKCHEGSITGSKSLCTDSRDISSPQGHGQMKIRSRSGQGQVQFKVKVSSRLRYVHGQVMFRTRSGQRQVKV